MELMTILLSGLLGILAPVGLVSDRLATNALRDQLASADTLAVRIDNAPNYQILQGKVQRVRIAGRGIVPEVAELRLAALELETDEIVFDPGSLRQGQLQLEQPLQAGVRLEVTEADVNQFLQSEAIAQRWQTLDLNLPANGDTPPEAYRIKALQVDFLKQNRLKLQVTLQGQQSATEAVVTAESGLSLTSGRQLQLVNPQVSLGDTAVPTELITALTAGLMQQLDLERLQSSGLTARVLNFQINDEQIDLATFVRVEPRFLTPDSSTTPPTRGWGL